MYFDLFLPFPTPEAPVQTGKKKDKGKGKAATGPDAASARKSCWDGLASAERDGFARNFALAGHLGYSVVGLTVPREPDTHALPSPFTPGLPYPQLDPRHATAEAGPSRKPQIVQVTRYHSRLDSAQAQPLTASNTMALREYDILSCQPTNEKALQMACTDLSNPGPNQLSIITLPMHERSHHFRLNRRQIKQALRNGVVLEILYAAALFPSPSVPPDIARRYRQNWMSNAKEIVRITNGGKGVILSSGPGGCAEGMRGPQDVINLATVLGMPANLAKDAVSLNPKMVLLRAQARRTFKAVFTYPTIVPAPTSIARHARLDPASMIANGEGLLESGEPAASLAAAQVVASAPNAEAAVDTAMGPTAEMAEVKPEGDGAGQPAQPTPAKRAAADVSVLSPSGIPPKSKKAKHGKIPKHA